ncbi:alkaline phosphatase PhoX [Tsuneonella sp. HG222]
MHVGRRQFLGATGAAFAALAAAPGGAARKAERAPGYGELVADPAGLAALPAGFSYRVIAALGDAMSDGGTVPDRADGMGCFDLGQGKWALVCNHEIWPQHGPGVEAARGFVRHPDGNWLAGGTTTLVLDARSLTVERQVRTLAGTLGNCAGGITPWGSWLSCEEAGVQGSKLVDGHGWVFEVPATATGPIEALPLKAMGRFNHEAACVDPATGVVYMTEDRPDGLLYRFLPREPGRLVQGGRLQALSIRGPGDTRNWQGEVMRPGAWHPCRWVDLSDVEAPEDDLRQRGAAAGGALFARGEGIWMGEGELYFTCTNGGAAQLGQVFRLRIGRGRADRLQLFYESRDAAVLQKCDNLTISPKGHLIVCEDGDFATGNHLRGITPAGEAYTLARLGMDTEWAGACFSPDGRWLFVNAQHPTRTLAITGPW